MNARPAKMQIESVRKSFRSECAGKNAAAVFAGYRGRIALVLSGGGARGAYEAGALLAFQDAGLPTHIITGTSIGSINAASFAAHSPSLVGNAEPLVDSWLHLTPAKVGIEWTRYVFMLAGFLAMSVGIGELWLGWLAQHEVVLIHLHRPQLTWLFLALSGAAMLFVHDRIGYLGRAVGAVLHKQHWRPEVGKLLWSALANAVVLALLWVVVSPAHLHVQLWRWLGAHPHAAVIALVAALLLLAGRRLVRDRLSYLSHLFLRMPLRSGLFSNAERLRLLCDRIPMAGLRRSPIRVVMTATNLQSGQERYFSNATRDELLADHGSDPGFVTSEVDTGTDLLQALIASSAIPIVYEAVPIDASLHVDGGVVMNQPVRPAIKLGADVVFVVIPEARQESGVAIRTFIDMGMRALEIMMARNLQADSKMLAGLNRLCEQFAVEAGTRPEQVVIEMGDRCYRYVKLFTLRPRTPLGLGRLDFRGDLSATAIMQGYRDGCAAALEFLEYARQAPVVADKLRVVLRPAAALRE